MTVKRMIDLIEYNGYCVSNCGFSSRLWMVCKNEIVIANGKSLVTAFNLLRSFGRIIIVSDKKIQEERQFRIDNLKLICSSVDFVDDWYAAIIDGKRFEYRTLGYLYYKASEYVKEKAVTEKNKLV